MREGEGHQTTSEYGDHTETLDVLEATCLSNMYFMQTARQTEQIV